MSTFSFEQRIKKVCSPLPGSIPENLRFKLFVKLRYDGLTILEMYSTLFPHQSQEIWRSKIEKGLITVNDKIVSPNFVLKAGWKTQNIVENRTEPVVNPNIQLVFENDDFIVVDKPSPLPIHPAGRYNRNTLTKILELAFPEWELKVIHRIDANTTGLVVLAKNAKTANEIAKQFDSHVLKKEYIALVEGIVEKDSFEINQTISKYKTAAGGREIVGTGAQANTKVKVVERRENTTLLSIVPISGRTNQIRLHLASIGHPIIGDIGYKDETYFENNPLTYENDCLFLHAYRLSFYLLGKKYSFEAELPIKFYKKKTPTFSTNN